MILLLRFVHTKRHGTARFTTGSEHFGRTQTHWLLTLVRAQFSGMELFEQVLRYFEVVFLEVLILDGVEHVLIGTHFLLDGVKRDFVQYGVNHLEHALVSELILIPQIIELFPEFVPHLLRDGRFLGHDPPEIDSHFVYISVVFLAFLTQPEEI